MLLPFSVAAEKIQDIAHRELAHRRFALDGGFCELAFFVLEGEDAGFDGAGDGEFVDGDVAGLVEAVDAVNGLVFDELGVGLVERVGRRWNERKGRGGQDIQDSKTAPR